MKNPHGWPRYTTRITAKKWPISDDFGLLRSPVIQKTFQTNNATSIVARVPYGTVALGFNRSPRVRCLEQKKTMHL